VSEISVRGGYRYAWLPSLELGAVTSVAFVEGGKLWAWRIQPLLRTKLDLGDFELGASLQPGFQFARLPTFDLSFVGPIVGIGVDAGLRLGDRLTLDVGADASLGWAKPLSTDGPGTRTSFRSATLMTLVFVPWIGATLRL
jgi:hypothetical protein